MKSKTFGRVISVLLLAVMLIGMIPTSVFAAATYTKISSFDELVTGKYVMVASNGYAPGVYDNSWVTAVQVSGSPDASSPVWDIVKTGTDSVTLTDANGVSIAPKGGDNNGIISGAYSWNVTFDGASFVFSGTGNDTVKLASNNTSQYGYQFRGYKNTTIAGKPSAYPYQFTLYKVGDAAVEPDPSVPTAVAAPTASPAAGEVEKGTLVSFSCETEGASILYKTGEADYVSYTEAIPVNEDVTFTVKAVKEGMTDSEAVTFAYTVKAEAEEPGIVAISEALADETGAEFTVKGVVTMVDGMNIYLQDATGSICAYMSKAPSDISLGDTIIATGSRGEYRAMRQLSGATYVKSEGLTLTAKATTIDALTADDVCGYVKLTGLVIDKIDDGNGSYAKPNITVKDANGNSIQIYKAVIGKNNDTWEYAAGDVVDITCAVGTNNGTLQLRNTLASEIVKSTPVVEVENHIVTDLTELTDGAKVVIFNPANLKALSQVYNGHYNTGVDITVTDGKLSGYGTTEIWTVGVNEDGSYTFSTAMGEKLAMGASYTSMPLDEENPDWTIEDAATAGCVYIKNVVRKNYVEWFDSKNYWSSYTFSTTNEGLFAQQFYLVVKEETPDPKPEYSTIAEALAGETGAEFTVKGVVALVDGLNVYIQDSTGAICVRMSSSFSDISQGDTIIGTGKRATYNGLLPQLGDATYEKSEGMTLSAKATTISALTNADICAYIELSSVEITEIYDNNGGYANPNITVKDANGNTIQIYKAVIGKNEDGTWEHAVGDLVDVKATVSAYKTTLQLRNMVASEITAHVELENHIVTDLTELTDGAKVVIFNPANLKALSQVYNGNYNTGVDITVTDGKLSGYGTTEIWTVGVNEDGSYTFSTAKGEKLAMGASYTSMPLDDVNPNWTIDPADTADCFYIKNTVRGNYVEWYADKGNWSSYYKITEANEGLFAQQFYLVVNDETPAPVPGGAELTDGAKVVIYNVSAQGVLAAQDSNTESPSITGVLAEITEAGTAIPANGARVFTVQVNGEWYRFYNETDGYLCSNGTGNNAFYSKEATEDADWKIAAYETGFTLESRTAKYNGKYSQFLEYYADSYKTYSMYNVTDGTIYTFNFYPVAETVAVTDGIVNVPAIDFGTVSEAYIGQEYSLTFSIDAVFGVEGMPTAKLGDTELTVTEENGVYTALIPVELVTGEKLTVTVTAKDTKGAEIVGVAEIPVLDEPVFSDLTPKAGSQTGDDKRPLISAKVVNAGENPTIVMTINDVEVEAKYEDGVISYQSETDMEDGRVVVVISVTRADGKEATKTWNFTVGVARYQLYFGQLHSHTTYSDGSGSLDSAFEYVSNLPESANVDFVAFTDHSNYFDKSGAANPEGALYDMSLATEYSQTTWSEYKNKVAAFNASQSSVVAIGGYEMTWSGGPGHINTFNTPGIVSRNNTTLNNKTDDAGMRAYYALLSQPEGADSISQFNHPGSTFGTFSDFAYYDALIDSRIFLVEVGNGEGQIGAGGYYPSYEYYIMALDKGWHVAPINNQDNHKGKWGNANDARDVILTDNFSEQGLYEAIRAMRMYATEDKNLEINYTVNGLMMGSSIAEKPEKLDIAITVNDPDPTDSLSKVEVVANSGKVVYAWTDADVLATGAFNVELDPDYSYYFVRVTQGDGNKAVTAPVWVGAPLKLGISSVESSTSTPVTNEELTLTTTFFNSEASDAIIKSITYTADGSVVVGTDTEEQTIPASGTLKTEFKYTPGVAKVTKITVTAVVEQNGKEFIFTKDIELDILDSANLIYIGIDASHYNEYVNGNYKDSMGNFSALAAQYSVRTVILNSSEDLIAACSNPKYRALILTAPSRRSAEAQASDPLKVYTAEELAAISAFNSNNGTVILAGWSDHYENYSDIPNIANMKPEEHMAATQNAVLEALGSSLRISDDATYDDSYNGGQAYRLYFNTYGDSFLTEGVVVDPENPHDRLYTEVFSHYGGASVVVNGSSSIPGTVTPVVFGHSSTYSVDVDGDGLGGSSVPKYTCPDGDQRLMIMATEKIGGKGLIIVSGAAFMSNFEVQATVEDNGAEKNYSNYKICENLLKYINPTTITPIATVREQTEAGYKYTIEGVVTSNASGYDKSTAFFDCIYVQDATGGICCFPIAGNYKIGDKVQITGTTDFYQGEAELQVSSIKLISENNTVEPTEVTAKQLNDRVVEGQLITVKGTVESFAIENGLVQTIYIKDAEGNLARVFIDGYITTAEDVKNLGIGATITATGLASYDDTFEDGRNILARIRIRNRADVICSMDGHVHDFSEWTVRTPATCTEKGVEARTCLTCACTETREIPIDPENHTGYGEWKVTTKPTCTEDGVESRSCACGDTETRVVKATGHKFGDWVVVKKPTEFKSGLKERTCSICGEKETQRIPPTAISPTGDNTNLPLLISIVVVTLTAAIVLIVIGCKKRKK